MLAERIARHLEANGVGTYGQDLVVGFQPDSPDDVITFEDVTAPTLAESDAFAEDNTGLDITVRSKDYAKARDTSWDMHKLLVAFAGDLDGVEVTDIRVASQPACIGYDEDQRAEFFSSYVIRFQSSGDAHRGA